MQHTRGSIPPSTCVRWCCLSDVPSAPPGADSETTNAVTAALPVGQRALRVLAVIPGAEVGASFIFARRQVDAIRRLGVAVQVFWLGERTSPIGVARELLRLRRTIAREQPDV